MTQEIESGPGRLGRCARVLFDEPRFLMLLPGLFWAGNAIVARSLAGDVPPIGLVFWRWTVGAVLILPFAARHLARDWAALARSWPIMLLLSVLGISIFNTFLYISAHTTTALNIVMLQSALPVMIVLMTFLLFRDRLTGRQALGIAVSLAGTLVLIAHGDLSVLAHLDVNEGDLWMLAAVVSYAVYTALLRLRPPVHALSFLFAIFTIGSLVLLPFYLGETLRGQPVPLTMMTLLGIGYVAIFASIIATLAFNRTVELLGANAAGLVVHLVPVFGTILAVLLLGERFQIYHAVGIGLIGIGLWLATRRLSAQS
jgi:drug/metabolite transporter (DMT)-like permease